MKTANFFIVVTRTISKCQKLIIRELVVTGMLRKIITVTSTHIRYVGVTLTAMDLKLAPNRGYWYKAGGSSQVSKVGLKLQQYKIGAQPEVLFCYLWIFKLAHLLIVIGSSFS